MKKIKDIQKIERPRERLERYGTDRLSDEELLAIVLGSGVRGMNVKALSKEILKRIKKADISSVTHSDLESVHGLGKVKCQKIIALLALSKRLHEKSKKEVLKNKDVWNLCNDFYASAQEHLVVFFLDTRSHLIKREMVFKGTLNESIAHPRDIFESALRFSAASVIVVHNHPSGDTEPSDSDIAITQNLIEAGRHLGIPIQDHLIVTPNNFFSMKEESAVNF